MRNVSLVPSERVFEPIRSLTREMDRLFQDVFGDWAVRAPVRFRHDGGEWHDAPRMDVMDRGNEYVLRAEVPGFRREDLHVDVSENAVTLKGERHEEEAQENERYICRETWSGTFERTIRLPEEIRPDDVTAKLKDGVLTLVLPKAQQKQVRHVEVTEE